jgi:hypothetical protein
MMGMKQSHEISQNIGPTKAMRIVMAAVMGSGSVGLLFHSQFDGI